MRSITSTLHPCSKLRDQAGKKQNMQVNMQVLGETKTKTLRI